MRHRYNFSQFIIVMVFVIAIIYIGCKRDQERKYLKETITNLLGKSITFPDTVTLLKGSDLIRIKTSSILGSEYSIIKQITADCPRCIHDLRLFQEVVTNKMDTSVVKPIFIIFTTNFLQFSENVLPEIKEIKPLVIDTLNRYILENHLPLFDQRFHTFLLDSQNRILIIGDPTNPKIGQLYKRYIQF